MTNNEKTDTILMEDLVYDGPELECVVNNLLPGRSYPIKLRAVNEVGKGEWSEIVEFTTAASNPEPPEAPSIIVRSSNCLVIYWNEPNGNGSTITEYRLECSPKKQDLFKLIYSGQSARFELKCQTLQPSTQYFFRVQAVNANGSSGFSDIGSCVTTASVPGIVGTFKASAVSCNSIHLIWKQPASNGSAIGFYNLDLNDLSTQTDQPFPYIVVNSKQTNCEYLIENLLPDTIYK